MGRDKVHCHKPLLKGEFGVLKYSSYKAGETPVAMGAFELVIPISAGVYVGVSAEGAYYFPSPSLLGDEITASLFIAEMVGKGDT